MCLLAVAFGGCSRESGTHDQAAVPTSAASAAPAAPPAATPTPQPQPAASGSPELQGAEVELTEHEWDLAEEAEGPEFEIDADATSYYMPSPNLVTFKAKALNGMPPFTFTWDFGDGSPEAVGEQVQHTFTGVGRRDVRAVGKDANGETYTVVLGLMVATPEEFAARMQIDPKKFDNWKPYPTPTP